MSKVEAQRPRYIAFRIAPAAPASGITQASAQWTRRAVADAVKAAADKVAWRDGAPRLTRFEAPHGIVRVSHHDQAQARKLLDGLQVGPGTLRTLGASGTLLALTARLGLLQQRDAAAQR